MVRRISFFAVMLCVLTLSSSSLFAQGAGGGGGGGGGGRRGQGGNFDPAQAQQAQLDNIKTALAASDDEWKVLQPKIEKLITANNEAQQGARGAGRGGRGGGAGGPNGGGRAGGGRAGGAGNANSAVALALNELRTLLENPSAPAEQITQKLNALRDARAKARAALDVARKDVKDLLTARQEAVLVAQFGLLE